MKLIRLTEGDLHDIVRECVYKIYSSLPLYEYAYNRSKFIESVDALMPQIIQNWCLIRYCRITKSDDKTINHWKSELTAHLKNLCVMQLKGGNKPSKRLKAVKEAFGLMDYFNRPEVIKMLCEDKFIEEGINPNTKESIATFEECFGELNNIASLIANFKYSKEANDYINAL